MTSKMWIILLNVTLLLTTLMAMNVDAAACREGWFGKSCAFECHCQVSKKCGSNGECPTGDRCELNYFGVGCQYVDLAREFLVNSTEAYVYDHMDDTCNPHRDATFLELKLKKEVPFLGFRILMKQNIYRDDFIVKLNGLEECSNQKVFFVSETVVDVTCDTAIHVNSLVIDGPIAPFVCDVYINGGRNVAVKQTTTQSSLLFNTTYVSAHAVDGITDNALPANSCSHTEYEANPWWQVSFIEPHTVITATIYNRDSYKFRLAGFTYSQFSVAGDISATYQDESKQELLIYTLYTGSRIPVTSILIESSTQVAIKQRALTLCEVQLLGEQVCPDGMYGFECDKTCQCDAAEVCHAATGQCAPGCEGGFYGLNCLTPCPVHCREHRCFYNSGICIDCETGYVGQLCDTACPPGTFGVDCRFKCAKRCIDVCDFRTGLCTCDTHTKGVLCKECPRGYFGTNCSRMCSGRCKGSACNIDTAKCTSCIGKRVGPFCQDCPTMWYGPLCDIPCSQFCVNGTCHNVYGTCSECTHGYTGDQCRQAPTVEATSSLLLLPIWLILVFIFMVLLCLRRRRKEKLKTENWPL